jgi:hypothetical protein
VVAVQLSGVHCIQKQSGACIDLEFTFPSRIERGTTVLKEVIVLCRGALLHRIARRCVISL